MSTEGFRIVDSWLAVAEAAIIDGDRKTAEDMTTEAYRELLSFSTQMVPNEVFSCVIKLKAILLILNDGVARKPRVH